MCGRYYIDEKTLTEMEEIVERLDQGLRPERRQTGLHSVHPGRAHLRDVRLGDVHPSEKAPVIAWKGDDPEICVKKWGFPGFGNRQLIFNARSETVLEKKMFRDSVLQRRCVIPAAQFYEWNASKEKFTFHKRDGKTLYLAGFYRTWGEEEQFVILTTAAGAGVKEVHERMPLLVEAESMRDWLTGASKVEALRARTPELLERLAEYEQQSLW